ncbi:MAG TPA: hypothetical protein VF207_08940, partial [Chthoniobacterales bacterium]
STAQDGHKIRTQTGLSGADLGYRLLRGTAAMPPPIIVATNHCWPIHLRVRSAGSSEICPYHVP